MKMGIMQPYFMPYIGYFSLINEVDEFMVFDTPQFMRKGWIERNFIAKIGGGESYIKVPLVKSPLNTPINQVYINNKIQWRDKLLSQLQIYKKRSPYFKETIDIIDEAISIEVDKIADLNLHALKTICKHIGINTNITVFSNTDFCHEIKDVMPDEWALEICKRKNCNHYVNAIGGKTFFDVNKYLDNGIDIDFIEIDSIGYRGLEGNMTSNLSIVDVMMFNSVSEINEMLKSSRLVK